MVDYLICIDFEASCYPSYQQRYNGWFQEIVGEFILLTYTQNENCTEYFFNKISVQFWSICPMAASNNLSSATWTQRSFVWLADAVKNYEFTKTRVMMRHHWNLFLVNSADGWAKYVTIMIWLCRGTISIRMKMHTFVLGRTWIWDTFWETNAK